MCLRDCTVRIGGLVLTLSLIILAIGSVAGAQPAMDNPPDPQPLPPTGIAWLDNIYFGATPPQANDRPVLVFVHGYGGTAQNWWTSTPCGDVNDMYATAYQAGYRTAFVNLGGSDGQDTGSMWDDGKTLSWQLKAIAGIYRVDELDIVAHSKGGVDAQDAVVYRGLSDLVRNVFTLGTPHQGSELADLVYSQPARWLTRLLGLQNDATYSLQTGYMQYFRALTDPIAETQDVTYYTAAGTDTGPLLSTLWLTGLYLSSFGPNDGVVTVASTELVGARTLFVQPYHHYDIFLGHTAFPWIDDVLRELVTPVTHTTYLPLIRFDSEQPLLSAPVEADSDLRGDKPFGSTIAVAPIKPLAIHGTAQSELSAPMKSDIILRGGRVSGPITETLPIEPEVLTATFNLFVSDEAVTATLIGPDGQTRPWESTSGCGGILTDIPYRAYIASDSPGGEWTIDIDGPPDAAYFLIVIVESPMQVTLHGMPDQPVVPGSVLELSTEVDSPLARTDIRRVETTVVRALPGTGSESPVTVASTAGAMSVRVPSEEGVYVTSVTVTGETKPGVPFERSVVRSFAVVKPETLRGGPPLLDE